MIVDNRSGSRGASDEDHRSATEAPACPPAVNPQLTDSYWQHERRPQTATCTVVCTALCVTLDATRKARVGHRRLPCRRPEDDSGAALRPVRPGRVSLTNHRRDVVRTPSHTAYVGRSLSHHEKGGAAATTTSNMLTTHRPLITAGHFVCRADGAMCRVISAILADSARRLRARAIRSIRPGEAQRPQPWPVCATRNRCQASGLDCCIAQ
jgi:hypothetical protein